MPNREQNDTLTPVVHGRFLTLPSFGPTIPRLVLVWVVSLIVIGCEPAAPPRTSKPPVETRKTIGKTTQNVLLLEKALAEGGVLAETAITSDGLEVASDAYRTSVGKLAGIAVQQKLNLYQAEHGSVPSSYEDFMAKIIEPGSPNGLQLPMLPYYQEYAYDPGEKKLVVVEFPAKKEQRQQETTGAAGI